jgi:hypothetical protein
MLIKIIPCVFNIYHRTKYTSHAGQCRGENIHLTLVYFFYKPIDVPFSGTMFVDKPGKLLYFEKLKQACDEHHSHEISPGCLDERNRNLFDSSTQSRQKRNPYYYYKTHTQPHFRTSTTFPSTHSRISQMPLHGQTVNGSYYTNGRTLEQLIRSKR